MAFFEIKWKPSTTELRKFGLGSAAILALLGACVFWREHLLGMDFSSKTAGLVVWLCGFLHNSSWDFLSDIPADRLGFSPDRQRRVASQVRPPSPELLERLRWPSANKKIFPPILIF